MNKTNTGGPAFPGPYANENGTIEALFKQQGMTLRDYFAAKAMQSLLLSDRYPGVFGVNRYARMIAEISYEMADVMLKARGE